MTLPSPQPSLETPVARLGRSIRLPQFRFSERRLLLMAGDLVASVLAVLLALLAWDLAAHRDFTVQFVERHAYWFVLLPPLWVALARVNGYYNLKTSARILSSVRLLLRLNAQMLIAYIAIFFLSPRGSLPRRFILYYAIGALLLIGAWRAGRLFLIGWPGSRQRVVIVGLGQAGELIHRALTQEAPGDYDVIGYVTSEHDLAALAEPERVLGTGLELPEIIARHEIAEIILAYADETPDDVFQGVMTAYEQGVNIVTMPILYEEITGRVPIQHVGDYLWPVVLPLSKRTLGFTLYLALKRAVDITLALVGLAIFFLLLFPALALLIKRDSPGPALYRQTRLGLGGKPFQVLKLRTMVANAERLSGPQWASRNDARITRIGRFLRKSRLDEVPQLLNVLRGEMSVVGPRPERPVFVDRLQQSVPFYRTRLVVKPGLTGWAQVRYRYGNSDEDALVKLQYDLYYIRRQSLALDLSIMARTVLTMLTFQGT